MTSDANCFTRGLVAWEFASVQVFFIKSMIPLSIPDFRGREAEYLATCADDNWVSSAGPFVTSFETETAALAGRKFGVATINGTAALHLALIGASIRVD